MLYVVAIYADGTAFYFSVIGLFFFWHYLELALKPESDLQELVDWGKKWLVDFNAGKTQLESLDYLNNCSTIDLKMERSIIDEKSSFKMLELFISSKLGWGF